ncbi:MAG: HU family DNA-binding protein [Clostridia bacterium]|nr:HU family DNA-binding protein [Clostridia bacterium]
MNKEELIKFASRQAKLSKTDCLNCLNAITDIIGQVLKRGDQVRISGFGKFEPRIRNERKGINPQTLKQITINQKIIPYFKSAKKLKENIK